MLKIPDFLHRGDLNLEYSVSDWLQVRQKNCSHAFEPMNRDKRRFIHEYCELYGISAQAYDEEPRRNIVVTATKTVCLVLFRFTDMARIQVINFYRRCMYRNYIRDLTSPLIKRLAHKISPVYENRSRRMQE